MFNSYSWKVKELVTKTQKRFGIPKHEMHFVSDLDEIEQMMEYERTFNRNKRRASKSFAESRQSPVRCRSVLIRDHACVLEKLVVDEKEVIDAYLEPVDIQSTPDPSPRCDILTRLPSVHISVASQSQNDRHHPYGT